MAARAQAGRLAAVFAKHDIPVDVTRANKNRVSVDKPAVRLLSMHTAQGPEFPCVAVGGLGALGRQLIGGLNQCLRLS